MISNHSPGRQRRLQGRYIFIRSLPLGCTWDRGSTPGEVDNLGAVVNGAGAPHLGLGTVAHGAEVTNLAEADGFDAVTHDTVVPLFG